MLRIVIVVLLFLSLFEPLFLCLALVLVAQRKSCEASQPSLLSTGVGLFAGCAVHSQSEGPTLDRTCGLGTLAARQLTLQTRHYRARQVA
jgi:hypothetical protein